MKSPEIQTLYKNLRELAGSLDTVVDSGELKQEILDFLAMVAALKPVFLLGRGLNSPDWVAGAACLARDCGFCVLEGPFWDATPFGKFPGWYRDYTQSQLAPYQATYVCSFGDIAQEIEAVNAAGGRLSMTAEARLLGYPECCVVAHYDRAVRYHQATYAILKRLAGGREDQMETLLRGSAALAPKTPEEISLLEAAFDVKPAPNGSWNQCLHCARTDTSPSAKLSEKYRALAATTASDFFQILSGT